jgi:hypothetical protein
MAKEDDPTGSGKKPSKRVPEMAREILKTNPQLAGMVRPSAFIRAMADAAIAGRRREPNRAEVLALRIVVMSLVTKLAAEREYSRAWIDELFAKCQDAIAKVEPDESVRVKAVEHINELLSGIPFPSE